jgi:hypothetical protein
MSAYLTRLNSSIKSNSLPRVKQILGAEPYIGPVYNFTPVSNTLAYPA